MTEAEWLSSTDPTAMLEWATHSGFNDDTERGSPVSDRKLRLWCQAVLTGCGHGPFEEDFCPHETVQDWVQHCAGSVHPQSLLGHHPEVNRSALLREIIGNPWRPIRMRVPAFVLPGGMESRTEVLPQFLTPTVLRIAEAIYADRDFASTPVLADALSDAGCSDAAILAHLRGEEMCLKCMGKAPEQSWQCRRCQKVGGRDQWTTRYGILECGLCLQQAYVGLLEPWRPACPECHGTGWRPRRGPCVRGCHVLDVILGKE